VAVGKNVNERLALRLTATNVTNASFLNGLANSFAGTHYQNPRELAVQLRWKFHY